MQSGSPCLRPSGPPRTVVRVRVPPGTVMDGDTLVLPGAGAAMAVGGALLQAAIGMRAGPGLAATVFRREGDYWTLRFDGVLARLRDLKGLRYIAQLLHHPDHAFSALELAGEGSGPQAVSGDVGPALDPVARAAYRRRMHELREEADDADRLDDLGRAERARVELEVIAGELAAAVGLGGRSRPRGSDLERARVAVTLRIRHALRRIDAHLPALASHLRARIETGRMCVYRTDGSPMRWLT